jgi:hypothetical protein
MVLLFLRQEETSVEDGIQIHNVKLNLDNLYYGL